MKKNQLFYLEKIKIYLKVMKISTFAPVAAPPVPTPPAIGPAEPFGFTAPIAGCP